MSSAAERATWKALYADPTYVIGPEEARIRLAELLADVERLERELAICGTARDLANEELIAVEDQNRRLREADL